MPDPKGFINCSIFCEKNQWHFLLAKCIKLFLEDNRKDYSDYYIHLASDQGAHIRLAILSAKFEHKISRKLEGRLREFLSHRIPPLRTLVKSQESVFMEFPVNTFYFDIFKPAETEFFSETIILAIRKEISEKMISQLANEVIDDDSIFSFLLYMHFAITSSIFRNIDDALKELKELINNTTQHIPVKSQTLNDIHVEIVLQFNEEDLIALSQRLWLNVLKDEDRWLQSIITLCIQIKTNYEDKRKVFMTLTSLLFEHLDLQKNTSLILSISVIYQALIRSKINKI